MSKEFRSKCLDQMMASAKDPSCSTFDLAKLLLSFIDGFVSGEVPCDFKEAALVLQASTSLYGRKVENLHSMVTSLHNILIQQEQDRLQNKGVFKEKAARKEKQWNWSDDISTEITPGKNLSALSRRNAGKKPNASKKAVKSVLSPYFKTHSFVPVDLLPLEGEEKGDIFYDTKGQPVGYTNDFAINRSRVHADGCLLFNTISPELNDIVNETTDNNVGCKGYNARDNNDEGYPPSSGCPSSAPNSEESGIGSLSCSDDPSSGISVDMEKFSINDLPPKDKSQRKSLFALLEEDEKPKGKKAKSKEFVAVWAPIGKKCTYTLPASLRGEDTPLEPIADFCARLFFDSKLPKSEDSRIEIGDKYSFLNSCFENNSTLCKRRDELYGGNKDYERFIKEKKGRVSSVDSDENVHSSDESGNDSDGSGDLAEDDSGETGNNSDGSEGSDELNGAATSDGEPANPGLEFDDIKIFRTPTHTFGGAENPITDGIPEGVPQETEDEFELATELRRIQEKETAKFRGNVAKFPHEEVNEKVRVWQKALVPFLNEINTRDKFDINLYGSRILDAFGNSNRRQTMTFRQFCKEKGLEKWEAHRFFMALLPLANMGNVELSNEPREGLGEEDDDIVITLLSRKMHHVDLEEFGHDSGEHK